MVRERQRETVHLSANTRSTIDRDYSSVRIHTRTRGEDQLQPGYTTPDISLTLGVTLSYQLFLQVFSRTLFLGERVT